MHRALRQTFHITLASLALGMLAGCRTYDLYGAVTDRDGQIDPDKYARFGREQAQLVAIGREFARAHQGSDSAAYARAADSAVAYARTLPDVVNVTADPLGHRLTVEFRSGWRVATTPIDDGKRGAETPNLPTGGAAPASGR